MIGEIGARGWVPAFVTFVTYQFFHADIAHLVGNMIFLWVFGDDIERALGRARYLAFYLLCGVIGGLVFVANDPHSTIELIGASGAIAGVVVALCDAAPLRQDHGAARHHPAADQRLLGGRPVRRSASCGICGASSKSEVAYWCHFGGMLAGAVLFPLMKPRAVQAVPVPAAGAGHGGADRSQLRPPVRRRLDRLR